ncbi:caspase family protein [Azospirillum brasilense]|uniref:caspase family protein n=1 Tax=Azospirillum brasilense TaxID=192 RepID=UPI001ED9F84E|nr:caspase family protein [Azospirillum brasilense]UKJ75925.1 caspase family protein [Azospirillum brasilense]
MNNRRHALLLAIADYQQVTALPYVHGDVPRMKDALRRMGVPDDNVRAHGAGGDDSPSMSRNYIRSRIREFLDAAAAESHLIVYFSGHGFEQENHRLLLPQDYDQRYQASVSELISDQDLVDWARESKAASVLFIIDTCRQGVRFEPVPVSKSALERPPAADLTPSLHTPTIAIVFSCDSGEFSCVDRQDKECSAFTRAFAEALQMDGDRRTLAELRADAQELLNKYQSVPQTIVLDPRAHGRGGHPCDLAVTENAGTRFLDQLAQSDWVRQLKDLQPWQDLDKAEPNLATQVASIALEAHNRVSQAAGNPPRQGWRAPDAPIRLLKRLAKHALAGMEPTPAEWAVLLAVPFVYETVLAEAERRLVAEGAGLDPLVPAEREEDTAFRRAWRTAGQNDDAGRRLVKRLSDRGQTEAATDVAAWRFNAFCHRAGELWDAKPSGWATAAVGEVVRLAPLPDVFSDPGVKDLLTPGRLLRLARLMFAEFEDVKLEETGQTGPKLNPDFRCGQEARTLHLDEVTVAHRLNLGARLALDARRLPPLLAEHLGSDGRLTLRSVQTLLESGVAWYDRSPSLSLGLTCPHEALDAALREAVDSLDTYHRRLVATGEPRKRAYEGLPTTFTAEDLKAEGSDSNNPVYDSNHLRFSLDQGRVMGLLMGKELYGDPDLALRELYQNALDACRYRRAHDAYMRKQSGASSDDGGYKGEIIFRFATDKTGRRYIECQDNGIGMADRHLRRLFARAGQRFTDSHEYHLDKARWEEAGIPFYPNSRFGIGVLSYFMLAEELEVESQRLPRLGERSDDPVHARVLGSGSLFRLARKSIHHFNLSGTRVRLYLGDQTCPLEDYRDAILEWLWLPEFRTSLFVECEETKHLTAGKPTDRFEDEMGPLIPMTGSEDSNGTPQAYWCLKCDHALEGGNALRSSILSDGILVKRIGFSDSRYEKENDHILGTAINMTEKLKSDLSVNRCEILSTNIAYKFIKNCINSGSWRDLSNWNAPKLSTLVYLLESYPIAIYNISGSLRDNSISMPGITTDFGAGGPNLPSIAGVCDVDAILFGHALRANQQWEPLSIGPASANFGRLLMVRLTELARAGMPISMREQVITDFSNCIHASLEAPRVFSTLFMYDMSDVYYNARFDFLSMSHISTGELLSVANLRETPISIVADMARSLQSVGVSTPNLDGWSDDFYPDRRHIEIMSRTFDGSSPFIESLAPFHLLRAAKLWSLPLSEVMELIHPLKKLGVAFPEPGDWLNTTLGDQQIELVSFKLYGYTHHFDEIFPSRMAHIVLQREIPINEAVQSARSLSDLGVSMPNLDAWTTTTQFSDLQEKLLKMGGTWPNEIKNIFLPIDLLISSDKLNIPLSEIIEAINPLDSLGFWVPNLDSTMSRPTLDAQTIRLLSREGNGRELWNNALSLPILLVAAKNNRMSLAEAIEHLTPILPFYPELQRRLSVAGEITPATETLIGRVYSGYEDGSETLSVWDLAGAAAEMNVPVSSLRKELDKLEILGIGNIGECRAFAEFCAAREGVTV